MALRSLGRLTLDVVARIGGFEQGMDRAARSADRRMKQIERSASQMGKAATVAAGLVVTAATAIGVTLTRMALSVTRSTDEMIKMGQRFGIAADEMQRLQYVADQTGANISQVGNAMNRITRSIADARTGSEKAADALDRLGLSATTLLAMGEDRAFYEVARSLSQVTDRGEKAQLAFALMGREGQSLLGVVNQIGEQFDDLTDGFDRFSQLTLTPQLAGNIQSLSSTMTDLSTVTRLVRQRFVAELAPAFDVLIEHFILSKAAGEDFTDSLADGASRVTRVMAFLMNMVDGLKRVFEALAITLNAIVATALRAFLEVVGAIGRAINGVINAVNMFRRVQWENAALIPTIDMTDFNRQLEDSRQTSRQFLRDFGQDLTATFMRPLAGETFLEKLGEHVPTVTAHVHDLNDALGATDDDASKRAKQIADMLASLQREADTFGESRAAIVAYDLALLGASDAQQAFAAYLVDNIEAQERYAAMVKEAEAVLRSIRTPFEVLGDEQERLDRLLNEGLLSWEEYGKAIEAAHERFEKATTETDRMSEFAKEAARSIQSSFADFLFDPFERGLKGMLEDFSKMIGRMVAEAAAAKLLEMAFGGLAGSGNSTFAAIGRAFGGGKQHGGRVEPWSIYRVNEAGMEGLTVGGRDYLLTGSQGGTVTPANRMGGGETVVNQTINVSGRPDMRTARQIQIEAAREQRIAGFRLA